MILAVIVLYGVFINMYSAVEPGMSRPSMSMQSCVLLTKECTFITLEVVSQSDRHGRIHNWQSESCDHIFGIEIITFIKLSKSPRPSKSPRLTVVGLHTIMFMEKTPSAFSLESNQDVLLPLASSCWTWRMVKRSLRSLPSDAMMTPSLTSHLCRRNRSVGFEHSRVAANTVQWPTSVAHEWSSARKLAWQRYPVSFCGFSLKDLILCGGNLWRLSNRTLGFSITIIIYWAHSRPRKGLANLAKIQYFL